VRRGEKVEIPLPIQLVMFLAVLFIVLMLMKMRETKTYLWIWPSWDEMEPEVGEIDKIVSVDIGPKVFEGFKLKDGRRAVLLSGAPEDFSIKISYIKNGKKEEKKEGIILLARRVESPERVVELGFGQEVGIRISGGRVERVPWLDLPPFEGASITNRDVLIEYVKTLMEDEGYEFYVPRLYKGAIARLARGEASFMDIVHELMMVLHERDRITQLTIKEILGRVVQPAMTLLLTNMETLMNSIMQIETAIDILSDLAKVSPGQLRLSLRSRGIMKSVEEWLRDVREVREQLARMHEEIGTFIGKWPVVTVVEEGAKGEEKGGE